MSRYTAGDVRLGSEVVIVSDQSPRRFYYGIVEFMFSPILFLIHHNNRVHKAGIEDVYCLIGDDHVTVDETKELDKSSGTK